MRRDAGAVVDAQLHGALHRGAPAIQQLASKLECACKGHSAPVRRGGEAAQTAGSTAGTPEAASSSMTGILVNALRSVQAGQPTRLQLTYTRAHQARIVVAELETFVKDNVRKDVPAAKTSLHRDPIPTPMMEQLLAFVL